MKIYNNISFFTVFNDTLYNKHQQNYRRSFIDIVYMIFFVQNVIFLVKYYSFVIFQGIKLKVELYILATFYKKDLYHLIFRYIDKILIFLDIQTNFVDLLKSSYLFQIFRVYTDICLGDNIQSILRYFYTQYRRDWDDRRFFKYFVSILDFGIFV